MTWDQVQPWQKTVGEGLLWFAAKATGKLKTFPLSMGIWGAFSASERGR